MNKDIVDLLNKNKPARVKNRKLRDNSLKKKSVKIIRSHCPSPNKSLEGVEVKKKNKQHTEFKDRLYKRVKNLEVLTPSKVIF